MSVHDRVLFDAFERLRLTHLAFRRAEPDEMRELEAMRLEVFRLEAGLDPATDAPSSAQTAPLRLLLMERAFHVLRLDCYANALENQGWMNLFREWGRSAAFNKRYEVMKNCLSPKFRAFYDAYLCGCDDVADRPIRHPWHPHKPGDRGPGLFMDTGRTEPSARTFSSRPGAGGVDDAKGQPGTDQAYETPSGDADSGDGTPVPNE